MAILYFFKIKETINKFLFVYIKKTVKKSIFIKIPMQQINHDFFVDEDDDNESNFNANLTFPIPRDFDITHDITTVSPEIDESFNINQQSNYNESMFQAHNVNISMLHDTQNFTQNFENSIIIEDGSIKLEENEGEVTFSHKNNNSMIQKNYMDQSLPHILTRGNIENRRVDNIEPNAKPNSKVDFIKIKTLFFKYLILWIILLSVFLIMFIISVTALALAVQLQNKIADLKNQILQIQSKLI